MEFKKIAIIGAGNLGFSIAQGLISSGLYEKGNLILTEKNPKRKDAIINDGYTATDDNLKAVEQSELIMLVVKPWQIDEVLNEIKDR